MGHKMANCVYCGKVFQKKCGSQKCCSRECGKERTKYMQMMYEKEHGVKYSERNSVRFKKPDKSVADIDAEAKKAGMSYGKYVSMMGL